MFAQLWMLLYGDYLMKNYEAATVSSSVWDACGLLYTGVHFNK